MRWNKKHISHPKKNKGKVRRHQNVIYLVKVVELGVTK